MQHIPLRFARACTMLWSLDPAGGPGKQDAGHGGGGSLAKRDSGVFLSSTIARKQVCLQEGFGSSILGKQKARSFKILGG